MSGTLLKLKNLIKLKKYPSQSDQDVSATSSTSSTSTSSETSSTSASTTSTTTTASNNAVSVDDGSPSKFCDFTCPICNKSFSNFRIGCVLGKCGHVFCEECVKNFFLGKENENQKEISCFYCHIKSNREKDLIRIKSEGTSFASSGKVEIKTSEMPAFY